MLGVDVSKKTLVYALLDPQTGKWLGEGRVDNTSTGVRELLKRCPPDVPWVLEPTGRYSLLAVKEARAAGRRVLMAPPRKARAYLESVQTRAKTDGVDGRGLAQFGAARQCGGGLPEYPVKTEAVERVDQLLQARRGLVDARTSLRQRVPELPYARETLQAALQALNGQIKALDEQIKAATAAAMPGEVERLQQIPGVGAVTAAATASRLLSRQFEEADQFVAYIGLDVKVLQSGSRKGQSGLTKEGDAELRRLFYMCAQSTVRSTKSPFRPLYDQAVARGRKHPAAVCIVARKIARTCWSLIAHKKDFQADRLFKQPDQESKSREPQPAVDTEP